MAKTPSGPSRASTASSAKGASQPRPPAGGTAAKANPKPNANVESDTDVEEDEIYALVSVLYHALQGASASRKYISDAQTAEDPELVEFFQRCRDDDRERAKEAKQLLVSRVDEEDDEGSGSADDEDEDDEEDEDDDEDEDDEEDEK